MKINENKKIKVSKNIEIKDLTKEELLDILAQKEYEIRQLNLKIIKAKRELSSEGGIKEYCIEEQE